MIKNTDEKPQGVSKLGAILSSDWQSYTWKNELAEQKDRISRHLEEIFTGTETEHNPLHMIERSVGVAALCMRRLLECRLITDRFRDSQLKVHCISRKAGNPWREPFISSTGNEIFGNYDLTGRRPDSQSPKSISDKLLHARVIAIVIGSTYMPNGLLVASDKQHKHTLFHFRPSEFSELLERFLNDFIRAQSDGFLRIDGKIQIDRVYATRD